MIYTKVSASDVVVNKLHEVASTETSKCIFYKKVTVERNEDWVWLDLPDNIIPLSARVNGDLTYFDWDGKATVELGFRYKDSGKTTVLSKTVDIAMGQTIDFNYTVKNLSEKVATQIGYKIKTRNHSNTCYIRVYKWKEKTTIPSAQKVKKCYIKTDNGTKELKAAVLNTESGPKVIFGNYDLEV